MTPQFRVTTVEAVFSADGWPRPTMLRWEGETLAVVDVGRRWRANNGVHVLVRVPDDRVFELHTNGSLWRAKVVARPPSLA
jgi:hypothetical protein